MPKGRGLVMTRRAMTGLGGGMLASLALPRLPRAAEVVEITMNGDPGGEVWFDPVGIHVEPGSTISWLNRDPENRHTATAYHPRNLHRPRRMPRGVKPWNSGYLAPGQGFSVTLELPGVYDYFCIPHEEAGMVGRIVVGQPGPPDHDVHRERRAPLPPLARRGFPRVRQILEEGVVRRY
jgi:plastocyanin